MRDMEYGPASLARDHVTYPDGGHSAGQTTDYAGFTMADLATLTPSRMQAVVRLLPGRTADEFTAAWRHAVTEMTARHHHPQTARQRALDDPR